MPPHLRAVGKACLGAVLGMLNCKSRRGKVHLRTITETHTQAILNATFHSPDWQKTESWITHCTDRGGRPFPWREAEQVQPYGGRLASATNMQSTVEG